MGIGYSGLGGQQVMIETFRVGLAGVVQAQQTLSGWQLAGSWAPWGRWGVGDSILRASGQRVGRLRMAARQG